MSKSMMTVDLEYDWETKESRSIKEVLPKLLGFFDDYNIKATFFVLGSLALKNIKEAIVSHLVAFPNEWGKLELELKKKQCRELKLPFSETTSSAKRLSSPVFLF